jgi:hypothetical protein
MKRNKFEFSNKCAPSENLTDRKGMNRTSENIKKNIKTSAKKSPVLEELKQYNLWCDEEWLWLFRTMEAGYNTVVAVYKPKQCR